MDVVELMVLLCEAGEVDCDCLWSRRGIEVVLRMAGHRKVGISASGIPICFTARRARPVLVAIFHAEWNLQTVFPSMLSRAGDSLNFFDRDSDAVALMLK